MRKSGLIILVLSILVFLLLRRHHTKHLPSPALETASPSAVSAAPSSHLQTVSTITQPPRPTSAPTLTLDHHELPKPVKEEKNPRLVSFVLEDGLAVIDGDVVIGQPVGEMNANSGTALIPKMHLWPTHEIPYHIQGNLSHPERIDQALSFFNDTAVHFIPYNGQQEDVLVFEESTGPCKSYVGKVGGKQPVWLAPNCGPSEIAHEIMHALGFVHEQNRQDRDQSIRILFDNIDPKYVVNFEKLPSDFMQISGLTPFAFDSIMIYPATMFASGSSPTMESKIEGQEIAPSETLSRRDITRLSLVYGRR